MTINVNTYVCMFPHSLVHETINIELLVCCFHVYMHAFAV